MKKNNNYSAQYKIISYKNNPNPRSFAKPNPNSQSFARSSANKKTLSKDRQEFINNISVSGFKQFQA